MLIVVNAQYFCLLKISDNCRKGSSCCSSDVQHILDAFLVFVSEADLTVSASELEGCILGEKFGVDIRVEGSRDVADGSPDDAENIEEGLL